MTSMATELDPNESDAIVLWTEIARLRSAIRGPDGYASWQDAAVAERVRRVRAEAALSAQAEPQAAAELDSPEDLCSLANKLSDMHGKMLNTWGQQPLWDAMAALRRYAIALQPAPAPAQPQLSEAEIDAAPEWIHLKAYGYAPGNYMSRCHKCGDTPVMDKRAITCRPCAETLHAAMQKGGA